MSEVILNGWQKEVINHIDNYSKKIEEENFSSLSDFALRKALSVNIAMPEGSGHTYLSNFIGHAYPSLLIYSSTEHYHEITKHFTLHPNTSTISLYEIYFIMNKPSAYSPSAEIVHLRKRFEGKVVVVDNALGISETIRNLILDMPSKGPVIFLGHEKPLS